MTTVGWSDCRIVGWALSLALLLSVYPTIRLSAQCPDGSPPPCPVARAEPGRKPGVPPNSVAVLYFDNLSPDTTDAYLAGGLTDEIITRLGQLERLAVKSRTAVRRYRGSVEGPAMLGRALGVAYLVNGTVRRAGNRLRVTVELLRVPSGDRVWGSSYDRTDADLLAIQEDVAAAVAEAIRGRLLPAERVSLHTRPTSDPRAYEHFLRGNQYLALREQRAAVRAVQEFEAAVARDPRFTRALARIAFAHALFHDWEWDFPGVAPESLVARGIAASARALAQDSLDSDSWLARGYLLMWRYPRTFDGARAALERAVALDPHNAEAYHYYGWLLAWLGEDSAASAANLQALAVDPTRAISLYNLARLSQIDRRFEEARRWLDSALIVDPGAYYAYSQRAQVRLLLGDSGGARHDAETSLRVSPPAYLYRDEAILARLDAEAGDTTRARERIGRLLRNEVSADHPTILQGWYVGMALVGLGDYQRALDFLERVSPHGGKLWFGLRMPEFDPIRSDPRFQRLVEESRPR